MADAGVELSVGGSIYAGWKSASVTRSIRGFSGAFSLSVTDNWTGQGPAVIRPGDLCELRINGTAVVTGYVDSLDNSIDDNSHTITVAGRDKTADLVDCSAITGQGELLNQDLLAIAQALAAPYGVEVKSETAPGAAFTNFSIQPGESVFSALDRGGKLRGVLFTTDGSGALVLTRVGVKRASGALVEGKNVKSFQLSADTKDRYARYVVKAQRGGTDESHGADAAQVRAEATDATVSRSRTLVIIAEDQASVEDARRRAEWEASTRAANSMSVKASVQGFEQSEGGALWDINQLVSVDFPSIGIRQGMLISEITMRSDDSGRRTDFVLVRPDAFLPQPVVPKKGEPE